MSGRLPMTAGERKLRLTVTVLDQGHDLGSILELLIGRGVAAERIGLIVNTAGALALASAHRPSKSGRADGELITSALLHLAGAPDDQPVLASRNLVDLWQEGWTIPCLWRNSGRTGAAPRLAPDLEARVQEGDVVLAIEAADQDEQWRWTRLLLLQSETPVMALEYSLPSAG